MTNDFSTILKRLDGGDYAAMDDLLRLVYGELRALAADKVRREKSDITLQATDLVNEAFLRLHGDAGDLNWESRAHFFGAASEAMRRILVEHARRKRSLKRGGDAARVELTEGVLAIEGKREELLAVHEALDEFEGYEKQAAQLVKMRYFVGMEHQEAAKSLGISRRTADRLWLVAKAWLYKRMKDAGADTDEERNRE